ncbi:hypothetical protein LCGC14_2628130, partial [marine sediment metagenome]
AILIASNTLGPPPCANIIGISVFFFKNRANSIPFVSYNNLEPEVIEVLPNPLVIIMDGVKITLSKKKV